MKNRHDYTGRIRVQDREYLVFDPNRLAESGIDIHRLPFCIRILLENMMRHMEVSGLREADLIRVARREDSDEPPMEFPFYPGRVLMQDFTGVPAVVDLAAMRDAVREMGHDPGRINPMVPVQLVVDHSVQADCYGTVLALAQNVKREYARNAERYTLLKWAQRHFKNFQVIPPGSGICHQVNLEYLAEGVMVSNNAAGLLAYPDTVVGTDSHTTMINGIGVMGWGVGGIEAEAVMLGQPLMIPIPGVVGVRLTGALNPGVTAADLALTLTELLRHHGVVEKFVEYYGPGMKALSVPDRATVANMAPEYGATMGFFPVDEKTIDYLILTGRRDQARLTEIYARTAGLFYTGIERPEYREVLELDLSTVVPSVAGPSRPQDRIALCDLKETIHRKHVSFSQTATFPVMIDGCSVAIGDGSIVLASITSCTHTSNPAAMISAGLLAKKAVDRGLRVPPFVKTTLCPGSRVVIRYLEAAGLLSSLQALGFHTAGFGCMTCIGNSGPLHPEVQKTIEAHRLDVVSVLSGNRNFEARVHQSIRGNFLASPMLVVAFAMAGRIDMNLTRDPIGYDDQNRPVYLKDIQPSSQEIGAAVEKAIRSGFFAEEYAHVFDGDALWRNLPKIESETYPWNPQSTYIRKPPYFENFSLKPSRVQDIRNARALAVLGDSVTTDHISPAGAIPEAYPAGRYLKEHGVMPADFNSYGSRRGNHEVMVRGTLANIRIRNRLCAGEGGFTQKCPEDAEMFIYDAAVQYQRQGTPLVILAGREYGTGSSRDWAAKGTALLGVRAVIAVSFERIHRSNLVGMGVLPLVFEKDQSAEKLGLEGTETFFIEGIEEMKPRQKVTVRAVSSDDGSVKIFQALSRLDTEVDKACFENQGILLLVLRSLLRPV